MRWQLLAKRHRVILIRLKLQALSVLYAENLDEKVGTFERSTFKLTLFVQSSLVTIVASLKY